MSKFKLSDEVIIQGSAFSSKNISGIVEDGYPDSYLIKIDGESEPQIFFSEELRKMTKLDRVLK